MNKLSKDSTLRQTIDEDSVGQRIDNYLMRRLKGVPKSHVYRILRTTNPSPYMYLLRIPVDDGREPNALLVSGMVMVGALAANGSPVKLTDATAIARLTGEYEVVAVHRDSPLQSMTDLIAMLKANPGSVSWAGGSAGGTDHILVGMIAKDAGVPFTEVAYVAYAGGGLAQATLLGNQVTCGVNGYGEFAEQIAAGNLRALAISSPERVPGIEVPTLREQGVNVDLSNWRGVFAGPGITAEQKASLIALMQTMNATPTWRGELEKHDWNDIFLGGDDFAAYLADETARITEILIEVGLAT